MASKFSWVFVTRDCNVLTISSTVVGFFAEPGAAAGAVVGSGAAAGAVDGSGAVDGGGAVDFGGGAFAGGGAFDVVVFWSAIAVRV